MKLVFIHGAPASGKLTVAKELLRIVPGRLFDNHVAIDFAKTVFDFGAPGFWKLVHAVRISAFEAAASKNVPLLVTTFCYASHHDLLLLKGFEKSIKKYKGEFLPVFLRCSEKECKKRVTNVDRVKRKKICSEEQWEEYCYFQEFTPIPRKNCLSLNNEKATAKQTAQKIVKHFQLSKK